MKEIEKMAEEKYPEYPTDPKGERRYNRDVNCFIKRKAFIAGAKSQSMSEWIDGGEQPPKINKPYLCELERDDKNSVLDKFRYEVVYYYSNGWSNLSGWMRTHSIKRFISVIDILPTPPQTSK